MDTAIFALIYGFSRDYFKSSICLVVTVCMDPFRWACQYTNALVDQMRGGEPLQSTEGHYARRNGFFAT